MSAPLLKVLGQTSLSAGVMILAVLALRVRFRSRTPQRVFCLLWDLVLIRLLVLAEIASPLSVRRLIPSLGGRAAVVPETAGAALVQREVLVRDVGSVQYASLSPGTAAARPADWSALLTVLWLAGTLLCGAWLLWGHLRSRRVYGASLPVEDGFVRQWQAAHPLRRPVRVRRSEQVASPLTYGVLYPVVLLPSAMDLGDREALSWVLAHEYTHIRRFDALRKGLLALALCLHWFNPLVWAMYLLANRDIELACDEAVIRAGADRRGYALALLRLEEERGRGFLSGSSFSRNALQERIEAIMKLKHFSVTALVAVIVSMSIATTVFATSAPEPEEEILVPLRTGGYIQVYGVQEKGSVTSRMDEDGNILYSVDGGETWMSEERYHAEYGSWGDGWEVEWWTAEDYAAWLEQEKKDLQELIGERAYTGGDGWFIWDQERVDETIALYESILADIQNGALYSRTIRDQNGNVLDDVALGSSGVQIATVFDFSEHATLDKDIFQSSRRTVGELLAECGAFGLTGSEEDGLFYNGQPVRYFVDGACVGEGCYGIRYTYYDENGAVDVHTLRGIVHNPDGSYNPMGELMGLAGAGEAGFDPEFIDSAKPAQGGQTALADNDGGMVFGIMDSTAEQPVSGTEVEIPTYMEDLLQEIGTGDRHTGRSFEEIFAQYADYGLTAEAGEASFVNLTWNGQPVRYFGDLKPDGSTFTYENPFVEEGVALYTVYDESGALTGLAPEPAAA